MAAARASSCTPDPPEHPSGSAIRSHRFDRNGVGQASIIQAPHRSLRAAALLLSASLLASSIVACGNSGRDDRAAGSGPLPIGAVIALTGNASVIGQDQRLGLELARDHFQGNVQVKGPALQGKGPALELTIEDGGSDEATATNAFRSLIGANVVALTCPFVARVAPPCSMPKTTPTRPRSRRSFSRP